MLLRLLPQNATQFEDVQQHREFGKDEILKTPVVEDMLFIPFCIVLSKEFDTFSLPAL